jgi:hypothetical protein
MKKPRSLEAFAEENRLYVELLRGKDPQAWEAALSELCGRLDDELAEEMLHLLQDSSDIDLRLQLLEQIALELDCGLYSVADPARPQPQVPRLLSEDVLERLQEYLQCLFQNDRENPRMRRKALEVAVLTPLPWQEEAVRECWLRPEPEWQATALLGMGHLLAVDFTEEIAQALSSPLEDLRAQAILAADARDLRPLGPRILHLAGDRSSEMEVRLCAIEALPNLRPEGARAMLEMLCREKEPIGHFASDSLFSLEQNEKAEARLEAEGEELLQVSHLAKRPLSLPLTSRFL